MNIIEFDISNYLDDHVNFEEARQKLNSDLISIINILLLNKYVMVVREDNEGLVKVEFDYSNAHFNNESSHTNPYWITKSEHNSLLYKDFFDRLP